MLFVPEQTLAAPVMAPPTEIGSTVITASGELVTEQTPPCTTALYLVVVVWLEAVREVVVLAISTIETQSSVVFCHLTMDPVCPERVREVLFIPAQTVAAPVMVPPTEDAFTVITATAELAEEQTPFLTTALKWVVWVRAPDV